MHSKRLLILLTSRSFEQDLFLHLIKERLTFVLQQQYSVRPELMALQWPGPACDPVMFSPGLQSFTMAASRQDDRELRAEKIGSFPLLICQLSGCQRRTASVCSAPQSFCPSLYGLASTPRFINCCGECWEYQDRWVVVSLITANSLGPFRHCSWHQLLKDLQYVTGHTNSDKVLLQMWTSEKRSTFTLDCHCDSLPLMFILPVCCFLTFLKSHFKR